MTTTARAMQLDGWGIRHRKAVERLWPSIVVIKIPRNTLWDYMEKMEKMLVEGMGYPVKGRKK